MSIPSRLDSLYFAESAWSARKQDCVRRTLGHQLNETQGWCYVVLKLKKQWHRTKSSRMCYPEIGYAALHMHKAMGAWSNRYTSCIFQKATI